VHEEMDPPNSPGDIFLFLFASLAAEPHSPWAACFTWYWTCRSFHIDENVAYDWRLEDRWWWRVVGCLTEVVRPTCLSAGALFRHCWRCW